MTNDLSTPSGVVTMILAVLQTITPIGAVLLLCTAVAVLEALFWASAKATSSPNQPFEAGTSVDHYYSRFRRAICSSVILSVYAGYAALWLSRWPVSPSFSWLHEAYGSATWGMMATIVVLLLASFGLKDLVAAVWLAKRWLGLEARGVVWHITDGGDAFRIQWRRQNGEYLFDRTVRGDRMVQQWNSIRERRTKLAGNTVGVALAFAVWLAVPGLAEHLSPVLGSGVAGFLSNERTVKAVFLFAVIPLTVGAIAALFDELVYQTGAQFVTGAKVVDPHIHPAGLGDVKAQNAHGEADYLTAEEAVKRMGGGEGTK